MTFMDVVNDIFSENCSHNETLVSDFIKHFEKN